MRAPRPRRERAKACWRGGLWNETTGTTAANAAPGGTAASLQGATWINDAVRGRVLSLEGGSDYVTAGATAVPVMTLTNDFTWVFHAWSGETGTSSVILGNRYSPSGSDFNPREFIKFTPAQFEFHRNGGGENIDHPDLPTGSWVHHAVVKKGASLTYYRNGTAAGSTTITQPTQNPQPLYFGGRPHCGKLVGPPRRCRAVDEGAPGLLRGRIGLGFVHAADCPHGS